jgi:hypothetical protein
MRKIVATIGRPSQAAEFQNMHARGDLASEQSLEGTAMGIIRELDTGRPSRRRK